MIIHEVSNATRTDSFDHVVCIVALAILDRSIVETVVWTGEANTGYVVIALRAVATPIEDGPIGTYIGLIEHTVRTGPVITIPALTQAPAQSEHPLGGVQAARALLAGGAGTLQTRIVAGGTDKTDPVIVVFGRAYAPALDQESFGVARRPIARQTLRGLCTGEARPMALHAVPSRTLVGVAGTHTLRLVGVGDAQIVEPALLAGLDRSF